MTATLAFEGFVAPDVPTDDPGGETCSGMTTRIGGDDVLAMLHEAATELDGPLTASLAIGNLAPIVGDLHVSRGRDVAPELDDFADDSDEFVDDPCCDWCAGYDFDPAALQVGDTDVLRLLEGMEGDQVVVDVTLAPKAPEPAKIVVVQSAHFFDYFGVDVKPGHTLELERTEAQRLAIDGYIERDSAIAAGLEMVPA